MPVLRAIIADGIRLGASALVIYEWRRGPRTPRELAMEQALLAPETIAPFGEQEAQMAARFYGNVKRPQGREIDLAIAASAMVQGAELWTLNPADYSDIPGIQLYRG